jgi:hypothetical protein
MLYFVFSEIPCEGEGHTDWCQTAQGTSNIIVNQDPALNDMSYVGRNSYHPPVDLPAFVMCRPARDWKNHALVTPLISQQALR